MKIVADTNLLVRAFVADDQRQSELAISTMEIAEAVVISNPTLCEFVWVMRSRYKMSKADVSDSIRTFLAAAGTLRDIDAVNAGLTMLEQGGDFADGVIAYEGRRQGGETFFSFDRKAALLLERQGYKTQLLT
mgnify:CR=1 FL=1